MTLLVVREPGSLADFSFAWPVEGQTSQYEARQSPNLNLHRNVLTVIQTVQKSMQRLQILVNQNSRVQCFLVVDGNEVLKDFDLLGIDIVRVPDDFSPSKAMHKARALEFFRSTMQLRADDWVMHLDEETTIDQHCLNASIDFIERKTGLDIGQVGL